MDWQVPSEERFRWQINTIEKIAQSLDLTGNAEVYTDHARGVPKNIIVFGMTQAGKTCILLAIAGIAPEYQKKVETLLRGGQEKGNSATSTAIIYRKTSDERFGILYSNDENSNRVPEYFDDDQKFMEKLSEIRKRVEENQHPDDRLNIYIPTKYFEEKKKEYNFNIIDLPGAGSRNVKEQAHVERLRTQYFPSAHVKIIVCSIEDVQSLQNAADMEKLLPRDDINIWKSQGEEYMLVLTSAYSMENIKKHFAKPRKLRQDSFKVALEKILNKEVIAPFGDDFALEVFPFDAGDSYETLRNHLDEADWQEISELRNETIDRLAESIERRKGNTLESTINKMRNRMASSLKEQQELIQQNKAKLQAKIKNLEDERTILLEKLKTFEIHVGEQNDKIAVLEQCVKKIEAAKANVSFCKNDIKNILQNHSDGKKLKDRNRSGYISDLEHSLHEYAKKVREGVSRAAETVPSLNVARKLDFLTDFSHYLSERMDNLSDSLHVGFFRKAPRIEDVIEDSLNVVNNAKSWVSGKVSNVAAAVKTEIAEMTKLQKAIVENCNDMKTRIRTLEQKQLPGYIAEIKNCDDYLLLLDAKKKDAEELLFKWLELAEAEYTKQFDEYRQLLTFPNIPAKKKIQLIITMGVIERDMVKILKQKSFQ